VRYGPKSRSRSSRRGRLLWRFIEQEILAGANPDDRFFLRRTSILTLLSGPLCDAVLDRSDSRARLARLAECDLLAQPLDRTGESFRMHGLFAEALRTSLERESAAEVPALHRRAAAWFAERSEWRPAITHALAGGDTATAVDLLWGMAPDYIANGRSGELPLLVAQFDSRARVGHPELDAILAWTSFMASDADRRSPCSHGSRATPIPSFPTAAR
jgi:LuxR family maltose regulon positive regulatory protein